MRIEIRHSGSESFHREVVCVVTQYERLMKNPRCKLKNYLRTLPRLLALCAGMLVLEVAMGIAWGFDVLDGIVSGAFVVSGLMCGVYLRTLYKLLRELRADTRPSVLTLDDEGVELAKEGGQSVRMAWGSVAFVRIFDESLCFLMRERTGFLVAVDRSYEVQVLDWLAEHQPDLLVIRAE